MISLVRSVADVRDRAGLHWSVDAHPPRTTVLRRPAARQSHIAVLVPATSVIDRDRRWFCPHGHVLRRRMRRGHRVHLLPRIRKTASHLSYYASPQNKGTSILSV